MRFVINFSILSGLSDNNDGIYLHFWPFHLLQLASVTSKAKKQITSLLGLSLPTPSLDMIAILLIFVRVRFPERFTESTDFKSNFMTPHGDETKKKMQNCATCWLSVLFELKIEISTWEQHSDLFSEAFSSQCFAPSDIDGSVKLLTRFISCFYRSTIVASKFIIDDWKIARLSSDGKIFRGSRFRMFLKSI